MSFTIIHFVHLSSDPPRITQRPKDVSLKELKGLTVSCKASGYPVPKITWVKHSDNRRVGQGESLLFHSVRREDSGVYKCVADNGEGKPAATYLRIDVKCEFNKYLERSSFENRRTKREKTNFEKKSFSALASKAEYEFNCQGLI